MEYLEKVIYLPYTEPEHDNKYNTHVVGDGDVRNHCTSCNEKFYYPYLSYTCDKCKTVKSFL